MDSYSFAHAAATFAATATYEGGTSEYQEFPLTDTPVTILDQRYSTRYDMDDLKHDILSRLWLTYRKNFPSIGGVGPTSDAGWGCMLRCGQMMYAHALILRHLGRGWRWSKDCRDPDYLRILDCFADKRGSPFSLHQIASMGVMEGKEVGQWFGPNTVAQVLRKLCAYDAWSDVKIHVAMDSTLVIDDVKDLCRYYVRTKENSTEEQSGDDRSVRPAGCITRWHPVMVVVPLRLGLSEVQPVYYKGLSHCLSLKNSCGIIGGKPNHAHWFIGYVGQEMVYLDPHTCQATVDVLNGDVDDSYHTAFSGRMPYSGLDPSVAVSFYCGTEAEFDELCMSLARNVVKNCEAPLFAVVQCRPRFMADLGTGASAAVNGSSSDDDDEFVLL